VLAPHRKEETMKENHPFTKTKNPMTEAIYNRVIIKDAETREIKIAFNGLNTTYADFQSIVNHWKEKHPEENVVVCYIVGDDTL
jgi:hypothetical protein